MIVTVSLNPALDVDYLVEKISEEDRNPILRESRAAGGKGLNVSRVVRELGGKTLAITTAGGPTGTELRERLRAARIPTCVVPIRGETRTNLAITEYRGGRSIRLNQSGPQLSRKEQREVFAAVERAMTRASVLVLSGSLPPNLSPDTYARLIRLAQRQRVPTVLDADGEALRLGLAARPWLVKPNRHEAERLLGRKLRSERACAKAAKEILEKWGVSVVLLSLGREGGILVGTDVCLRAGSLRVLAQSSIGAGDSALAAFLLRWFATRAAADSLRWAMAAGASATMTPATELCRLHDVLRLALRVKVLDWSSRIN